MESIDPKPVRPWYKKKRYIATLVLLGAVIMNGFGTTERTTTKSSIQSNRFDYQKTTATVPSYTQKQSLQAPVADTPLSNNNYYTNTYGNKVHSPAYSESIPIGASARCRDGTYSFSQSRRGTCSHHGGVSQWL